MSAAPDAALARFSPSRLDAAARQRIAGLLALIGGYRRRAWRRRAMQRAVHVTARLLPLVAVVIVGLRAALVGQAHDRGLLVASVAVALVLALWIVAHRLTWFDAARRVDGAGLGRDRAATAVELAVAGRTDAWVHVQAGAANHWALEQTPAGLLPFQWPRGLGWLTAGAIAVALSLLVPAAWLAPHEGGDRSRAGLALWLPAQPSGFTTAASLLSASALDLVEKDERLLAEIEKQLPTGPTRKWLEKVRETLEEVKRGALDKPTALARLAELEREQPGQSDERDKPQEPDGAESGATQDNKANGDGPGDKDAMSAAEAEKKALGADQAVRGAVAEALKKSLVGAPAGAEREGLKQAAARKDLEGMSKWVEKVAERNWTDKELEKWIKVAERFADSMADRKIPKRFEKLAQRVRRLQEKRKQRGGLSSADRSRLKSTRRSLQQLRKEHGDMDAAGHRLRRLERNARRAADELRRGQRSRLGRKAPKANRAQQEARRRRQQGQRFRKRMRQAAGELRREGQRQKQGHARRIGRARMRDLRQALGRSQRKAHARRDFERRAGSQRAASEARARERRKQGAKGQGKGGDRMKQAGQAGRNAAERAARSRQQAKGKGKGQKAGAGKGRQSGRGQGGAQQKTGIRLGQGDMSGQTRMRMMRDQAKGGHGESQQPGKGAGDSAGGPNKGKRSGVQAGRTEKVQGIHGKGPTVKQTFLDAARKGFARRSWRKVYADYNAVAQEMMDKETLPAGRKAMVRRYFEIIRPQ